MHSGRLETAERCRHDRADLAARPARAPPRPAAGDRGRRRRRRRAARVDRRPSSPSTTAKMTAARDRARAGRLAGRGAAGRQRRRACSRRSAPPRRARARCRSASPPRPACAPATGGSTQRTGPGRVLGLPDGYARAFPGELRTLVGRRHRRAARPADGGQPARRGPATRSRSAGRARRRRSVRVDGVVDLPAADSLFQQVGAPVGAQPQAPPDNVVLLPAATFGRSRARARRGPSRAHAGPRDALARAARQPERRVHRRCSGARAQPRDAARRRRPRRRQPRHRARPGAPGRALRAAAVPLPRRARARSSPGW